MVIVNPIASRRTKPVNIRTLLQKASDRLYRQDTGILLERSLDAVKDASPFPDITVRRLSAADLPGLAQLADENKQQLFAARLAGNTIGFGAFRAGRIVHYSWITFEPEYDCWLDNMVQVPSNAAYIFDMYTSPDERGKGIALNVLTEEMKLMKANGRAKAMIIVSNRNYSSLKVVSKLGFCRRSAFTRRYVLGMKLPLVSNILSMSIIPLLEGSSSLYWIP